MKTECLFISTGRGIFPGQEVKTYFSQTLHLPFRNSAGILSLVYSTLESLNMFYDCLKD